MGTSAKTVMGGSLISALAIGGVVLAGVVADPVAPPARAATGLSTFQDCRALQSWYVDHTLGEVGPYGWGGRMWTLRRPHVPSAAQAEDQTGAPVTSSVDGVENGPTGTNTQEAGVDEPDVAKTDGRVVVRLVEGRTVVITDVTGSSPRQIATWSIPEGGSASGLLLVGDHVLITGTRTAAGDVQPMTGTTEVPAPSLPQSLSQGPGGGRVMVAGPASTELIDLDLSDQSHPRLDSRTTWSGQQLSLRQYGDTVRLVTTTGLPRLPFVQPRPGHLTENQAEQRNREIVRSSKVEDWLPGFSSESGGAPGSLVGCHEVYHPKTWSGAGTVSVATFGPGAVESATAVAVTGAGAEVYSSPDRLYVTSTDQAAHSVPAPGISPEDGGPDSGTSSSFRPVPATRTQVHAFALDQGTTRYTASGTIEGTVRDRWSLDERDGHLRVALSWPGRIGSTRENGIVVLQERDGILRQVGELRGLGPQEDIRSVRWFDDLAVVVTFRQMDPLYTIDLRDPTQPRRLGSLKISGFSSYLHPIGGDRLLGIGTDATTEGQGLGAQAAVIDLSDRTRARQLSKVALGQDSQLGASQDPHALTWLPGSDAAITSLQQPGSTQEQVLLLRVSARGELSTERLPSPGGWQVRALPLQDGRVALVGSTVRLIDLDG